ncbi:MAG TPA: hypothetical protein VE077_15535 [Candidatus Methylomirabilis sp.]|nr:hypothetical protein [Candidatus Methylomirabilis sp.]
MKRTRTTLLAGALWVAAAGASPATNAQSPTPQAAEPAASAAILPGGTAVNVELSSSVDSKKNKVGDKVEARTTEAVAVEGKTLVPKGAKLEGRITEATARSKGDSGSTLAIQFEKAIPKNGEAIPLSVVIMAVAPPQRRFYEAAPGPGSDAMADRGAAAAGGSPMAGASRAPNPGAENPGYPSAAAPDQSAPSTPSGQLPAKTRGVVGFKDLKLMETKSSAGQATFLTSTGKEVRLEGGTRLLLIVQPK